jgi:hypothetical protein
MRLRLFEIADRNRNSMFGALVFGLWNHYLVPGTDNVSSMPANAWGAAFQVTAVLLAVTETWGCWAGFRMLRRESQPAGDSSAGTAVSRAAKNLLRQIAQQSQLARSQRVDATPAGSTGRRFALLSGCA